MSLKPILVAGAGRSGTTALMALLGSDPRVVFDRVYPFEHRHLTYLAKFASLAGSDAVGLRTDVAHPYDHLTAQVGRFPWIETDPGVEALALSTVEWMNGFWSTFSSAAVRRHQGATHYAEKSPDWLAAAVRPALDVQTIYLSRDPRDLFLSANAFNRARGWLDFGRTATDTDLDHARTLAHDLLVYYENQRADRGRKDCQLVRYEDMITDPSGVATRLSQALGLTLDAASLASGDHVRSHRTTANAAASVGRWKREGLPVEVREIFETHLYELLADLGYELSAGARPASAIDLTRWDDVSTDGKLTATPDGIAVTITGNDCWVELAPSRFTAKSVREVWLCLRGETGTHCALYWRHPCEEFAEAQSMRMPFRPGRHWQVMRFRTAGRRLWRKEIEQLRIDLFNDDVEPGRGGEVRWLRLVG